MDPTTQQALALLGSFGPPGVFCAILLALYWKQIGWSREDTKAFNEAREGDNSRIAGALEKVATEIGRLSDRIDRQSGKRSAE